jgi:hypothetical protein
LTQPVVAQWGTHQTRCGVTMGLFGKSKEEKLIEAAQKGDVASARAALDGGANVNCKDKAVRITVVSAPPRRFPFAAQLKGRTQRGAVRPACMCGCCRGPRSSVPSRRLATQNRRPSFRGCAALIHSAICRTRNGAQSFAVGVTPLHWAAIYGKLECALLLLERGADKDAKDRVRVPAAAHRAMTSRSACHGRGPPRCTRATLLRAAILRRCVVCPLRSSSLSRAETLRCTACDGTQHGYTPLHHAAMSGQLECTRLLIERGAAMEAKSNVRAPGRQRSAAVASTKHCRRRSSLHFPSEAQR